LKAGSIAAGLLDIVQYFIALCGFSEDLNPALHKVSHGHLGNFK